MIRLVPLTFTQTLVAVGLVVICVLNARRQKVRGLRSLPGPVPLPLVENMLSIDPKKPWITYAKWATHYGDIFKIRVLTQDMIMVNSCKIAQELLDRRSNIYSDRPYVATTDPFGWSFNFAWTAYGDLWRSRRRIFHQAFRAEAALTYRPVQLRKARDLVLDTLNAPHDFSEHIQRFAAAVIMSIVYDYEVAAGHDSLVELFKRGNVLALESLTPEASSIVSAFPFGNLPEWFPGAVLKRKAVVSKSCAMQMVEEPFEYARKREEMGSTASAMAFDFLREWKDSVQDPVRLQSFKDTCATAFVAGAETSASTLQCFMLVMLQYPEVQERAQAEIDRVVGINRLPNFDDRPNLPYVEAVMMEILRMHAVAPLGLPHATTADDVYGDIFIPKGSAVVANIWAMCHDKDVYPEPDTFRPEKFLVNGKFNGDKTTDSLAFGFGRRVCPGRHNADGSVWAGIVSILHAFKITKALNERGEEVEFEPSFSHGVTSSPNPFPCSITPRLDIRKLLSTVDSFEL